RARWVGALLTGAASVAVLLSLATPADAQALRDKWCKDVHIRFFVGGAEGDGFGTIVFNGAKQAQADTGAQVDFVFSGWQGEKMVHKTRVALGSHTAAIA